MSLILFQNASLIDGSGSEAFHGNLLVEGDRIAAIGAVEPPADCQIVDCEGLTVTPGFIDLHSHSDLQVLRNDTAKRDQGVTTEVVGNCGFSPYPCGSARKLVQDFADGILYGNGEDWGWTKASDYLTEAKVKAKLTNVVSLVGHGTLRIAHMGMRHGTPTASEMDAMEQSLDESLSGGASGFSTGLMYAPGSSAPRDELVRLLRVVAKRDKLYGVHMRSYSHELLESIDEQLDLARETGCRLQISHLQAVGRKNWDKQKPALEKLEKAKDEGIDVAFDSYPYLAGSTVLTQLLPQWVMDGGAEAMIVRLTDRNERAKIAAETVEQTAQEWKDIFIVATEAAQHEGYIGQHLAEIAKLESKEPVEVIFDLLIAAKGRVNMLSFNQSEDNLRLLMQHPLCSVISDGFYVKGRPHPRLYGTFPFLLGEISRNRKWLPLPEAIHKITGKPADRFTLRDRGVLAPGKIADVTVFDPERVAGTATYENPKAHPEGVRMVFRNGKSIYPAEVQ